MHGAASSLSTVKVSSVREIQELEVPPNWEKEDKFGPCYFIMLGNGSLYQGFEDWTWNIGITAQKKRA